MATRTPQVPGGQPTSTPEPTPTPTSAPQPPAAEAPGETLEEKVARLEADNQRLAAANKNLSAAVSTASAPAEDAPETEDDMAYRERARTLRAADVDPTRLKRAVLTVDGWVCPVAAPAAPTKQ